MESTLSKVYRDILPEQIKTKEGYIARLDVAKSGGLWVLSYYAGGGVPNPVPLMVNNENIMTAINELTQQLVAYGALSEDQVVGVMPRRVFYPSFRPELHFEPEWCYCSEMDWYDQYAERGWIFNTERECMELCEKLNGSINKIEK